MAAATAQQRHAARTRPQRAPALPQRRVSGPVARPQVVTAPPPAVPLVERLKGLPDHRVVDRLLRGRAWICLIGLALMGIVAMQVSLLKLNSGISRAVETSATLERQNSDMEADIARLASGERIRSAAENDGMVTPAAGDVHYVRVRPGPGDAARAAQRMRPPSDAAKALMGNHGVVPGSLMTPAPAAATATTTSTTAAAPAAATTTTTTPASTTPAAVTPAPTAAPVTPAATATPAPTSGGAVAAAPTPPQG
jgi:cell division protein FtsL